jgi:hypothetical protein
MSGSLRPVTPPETNADVTSIYHRKMTVNASRGFSRAGHMLYCNATTEIFSVRSSPYWAQSSGRDSAVKKTAAVPFGDL